MKKILNLFSVLMFTFLLGSVGSLAGANPIGSYVGAFSLSLIPQAKGSLVMAIQKEIWVNYIIENLFKDDAFMAFSVDESQYVVAGKIVHIPQAGAPSDVKRNRTQLPATVTLRKDVDILYSLDEFTTDPRLIPAADKVELSYDKIDSVMGEDMSAIRQFVADWLLYHWRPETDAQILRTTGDSKPAHLPNATGNRKALTLADVRAAKKALDKQNILKADRYLLIDSDMHDQLAGELGVTTTRDVSVLYDQTTGRIKKLEGFEIMERSTVLVATNAATPVVITPETAIPSTGNAVALAWQKTAVARAVGSTDAFESINDPTYFGDVYSFLQRMGGRKRRNDGKGIIGIVQAHA